MNTPSFGFSLNFVSDGTSTTVSFNLSTYPVFTYSGNILLDSIYLGQVTGVLTGPYGANCNGNPVVSASVFLGVATFTLSSPGPANSVSTITGFFLT